MKKRVMITGSSGFIGANITRQLLRLGHEVHLLLRRSHDPWRIKDVLRDVQVHEADLHDREALARAVGTIRPEWVFHLAVYGAYSWQSDLHQMVQTNIVGTVNLVEACLEAGFEVFLNTGSSSEYGFKDHAPAEREWLEPNSYYAVTKASASLFCRHIAQSRNVNMHTLRLYSVYGPYEEPTRFIPMLVVKGLRGRLPKLVNPSVSRDFVYVEDVGEAYVLAATRPHQEPGAIYNIGSGAQTSIGHVVETALRVMKIRTEPLWGSMPNRSWDTNIWKADTSLAKRELGWEPRYTFEEGFRRTITWFQENPAMLEFYETRISQGGAA